MIAAFCRLRLPPVPDQVAALLLFSVRNASTTFALVKLMPPFALVTTFAPERHVEDVLTPPHIVPPDQVNGPWKSISPVPPNTPPVNVVAPVTVNCPLAANPPLLILSTFATE